MTAYYRRWRFIYSRHAPTFIIFFFNDTATTEIYTLSLHDALPISFSNRTAHGMPGKNRTVGIDNSARQQFAQECLSARSEEHTSELQSQFHLVCRLLLEKKKQKNRIVPQFHVLHAHYLVVPMHHSP